MARVAGTGVVQVTQQTSLAWCTLTQEGAHSIYAGGAIEACRSRAIVDVLRAVISRPSVDTDAGEAALGVGTRRTVLAYSWSESTFINVLSAVWTSEGGWAGTRVGVHPVLTGGTVLTHVVVTIVNVHFTVPSSKSFGTVTLVGERFPGLTGGTVVAGRRLTRYIPTLTVDASVPYITVTCV